MNLMWNLVNPNLTLNLRVGGGGGRLFGQTANQRRKSRVACCCSGPLALRPWMGGGVWGKRATQGFWRFANTCSGSARHDGEQRPQDDDSQVQRASPLLSTSPLFLLVPLLPLLIHFKNLAKVSQVQTDCQELFFDVKRPVSGEASQTRLYYVDLKWEKAAWFWFYLFFYHLIFQSALQSDWNRG